MSPPDASSGRVLVADPGQLASAVVRRVLSEAGYAVTVVADAVEAMWLLRTEPPDVLLTAWQLPGIEDAGGLCRRIRSEPALAALPVIVLTANRDTDAVVSALEAGADDHVAKPFVPQELVARVNAAMRMVRLERERVAALEELRASEAAFRDVALEQASLRRVAATVASARTPEEVFSLVAREVAALLGCEGGGVARFEPGGSATLVGAHSADASFESYVGMPLDLREHWVTADVLRTGAPARVDDYGDRAAGTRRASVAAPVRVGGRLWGTVGAVSTRPEGLPDGTETRLGSFAELVSLAIANAQTRHEIAEMALRDPLTGLHNRRAFEEQLARRVAHAIRHDANLAMVIIDIDHFKRVNDTHGHQVGDMVLIEVAHRLARVCREEEPVARLGGEEFVWLLPDTDAGEAVHAAERARTAVAAEPFAEVGGITISAGVTDLHCGIDAKGLYRLADLALYAAKADGRNRVEVWREAPAGEPA
ncbi:MAG: diguanylate cyclase [Thermoleophilia bacterium]